ncbi:MAG: oxygen-independent coproporphyrinogen III oxidase [Tahibacter sp.]
MQTHFVAPAIFDADLIARHDVAGPRYTSYPTAPHLDARFGESDYARIARSSNEDPIPRRLSIYVHVPFCTSPCFYCGCTRIITRDRAKADGYLQRLYREIELTAPLFDRDRTVIQLHFGGGTPNFLDIAQMRDLVESLDQHFSLSRHAEREFGIEIDPRFADAAYVSALADLGFNRISVGIQDFDPAVQAAVNRHQGIAETAEVLEAARASAFRSTSVDLIYGLPCQTISGFTRTLDEVIALRPDRVAAYSYAHLPETFKAQRQLDASQLPDAATKLALLGLCVEKLTLAGYRYVGMDHFALPDDELVLAQQQASLQRNFQGYSTHAECDLLGLGMSAISKIGNSYSQNAKDLIGYFGALDYGRLPLQRGLHLSNDDLIRRDAIGQLMCHGLLELRPFEARHGIDFHNYFATEWQRLGDLETDGLVVRDADSIRVTARGRFLLRLVAMVFDAYLSRPDDAPVRYSRTI